MAISGNLRVTPEKLRSTSGQFAQSNTNVSKLTQQMMNIASELNSTWAGEAARTYYDKLKGLDQDIQKLTRMIKEHTEDLENMAKLFENAEKMNMATVGALGTSGIV
jgi:WXG100 family type VII secretion target